MVGKRIKAYLEERGIMQTFVAKRADLTASQMSDICNGKVQVNVITYYKICKALQVPLDYFLDDEVLVQ